MEKITLISFKNAVSILLCFRNLTKYGEMMAEDLVNFKSRSAQTWIVTLNKTNSILFILD